MLFQYITFFLHIPILHKTFNQINIIIDIFGFHSLKKCQLPVASRSLLNLTDRLKIYLEHLQIRQKMCSPLIKLLSSGARPTKHISVEFYEKIQNALVSNILDRSQRYFAHVTTVTVVTCAKYRCDQPRIFYTRVFWIFSEFRIRSKYA